MLGVFLIWNVVAAVVWSPGSTQSAAAPRAVAPMLPLAPPTHTMAAPVPNITAPNNSMPLAKKLVIDTPKLPAAPLVRPVPTTLSCPAPRRATQPKDTVYITLDDGPSIDSRENILQALALIPERVTFFESSYNICPQEGGLTLDCNDSAKTATIEAWSWTIKGGHMLAAHSDSHMFDPSTGLCDYGKMSACNVVPPQYTACGTSPVSDMVRGALRFQETMALADDSLWETAEERAAFEKQRRNMWMYARLPCSNVWRMAGGYNADGGWGDTPAAETATRIGVADALFAGTNVCKPDELQGQPWVSVGWDVEWIWTELKDPQAEKCRMVQVVENEFDRGGRDVQRANAVVVLGHDYHYNTLEKATMLRDLIVELKLRGYAIDTIDNLKL
ncbi:hypothetical protein ACHHYP_03417 [Achlya hypogyna]|uniref:Secreted protein n=1 Tax=Achlya hypogyna TaxID=1202772 RepID=A0A0A7CNF5_ACHHY|nr:secreted protein [Achlya hypogyna]OQS00562.1 hypothetical protein ACHHYP_03417 [Achlya hypogyna]